MKLHLYLQPRPIAPITAQAPLPVRAAVALDSQRSSNPPALESSRNHPPTLNPWKNCLPQNWSLVPERLGLPHQGTYPTRSSVYALLGGRGTIVCMCPGLGGSQIQGFQREDSRSPRHPGMSHLLCVLCQKVQVHRPREELTAQAGFLISPPLSSQGSGPAEFTYYRYLLASPTASPASVSPREALWCVKCGHRSVVSGSL